MKKLGFVSLAAAAFATAAPAFAQPRPEPVATYRDWNVFKLDTGDDTVCFAVSEPKDRAPKNVNHGDIFMIVSTWKSGAAVNQPSFKAGFNFRPRSTPEIRIGSDRFDMYPSDNEAFIEANEDERRLINAMKRGADMIVRATSARGTAVTYEISLLGVTAALDRVQEECS